jgi:hypothetical protein
MLAPRCDELPACDAVLDAVTSARARTAGLPGVRNEQQAVPGQWPPGSFDLVVLSELLYYFNHAALASASARCAPAGRSSRCTGGTPRPATPRPGRAARRRCGFGDYLAGLDAEAGAAPT